jgi:ribosomal protein S18 acetylase RimI-like enzyme
MKPPNLTRRVATGADRNFAREIHHAAYRDVVVRQFGSWDDALQDAFFEKGWAAKTHDLLICEDQPCGYIVVECRDDHVFLAELVLLPKFQNRGIGSAILSETLALAASKSLPLKLQTHLCNRAKALYERHGFKEYARTNTHILMSRDP